MFKAQVGHQCTDHRSLEAAIMFACTGNYVKDVISIQYSAIGIDHQQPVTVPIQGNTNIRTLPSNGFLQCADVG